MLFPAAFALLALGTVARAADYPAQKISKTVAVHFGDAMEDVSRSLNAVPLRDSSPIARPGQDYVLEAGFVTLKFDNRILSEIALRAGFDFALGVAPWPEPWRNFDAIGHQRIAAGTKKPEFMQYLAAWQERAAQAGARKVERNGLLQAGEYAVAITDDGIIDMIQIAFGPDRTSGKGGARADTISVHFVPGQSDHLKRKPGSLTGIFFSCDEFNTVARVPVAAPVTQGWEIQGKFAKMDTQPQPIALRNPTYPPAFLRYRIPGEAMLAFVVELDGTTSQVQYLSASDIAFAEAAVAAVKQWRFTPAMRNGEPIAAAVQLPMVFDPARVSPPKQ